MNGPERLSVLVQHATNQASLFLAGIRVALVRVTCDISEQDLSTRRRGVGAQARGEECRVRVCLAHSLRRAQEGAERSWVYGDCMHHSHEKGKSTRVRHGTAKQLSRTLILANLACTF